MNTTTIKTLLAALVFTAAAAACSDPPKQDPPADDCPDGDRGCECLTGDTCNGDLICFNAVCLTEDEVPDMNPDPNPDDPNPDPNPDDPNPDPNPDDPTPDPNPDMPFEGSGLSIDDDTARACEVVLRDPQNKIAEINFEEDTAKGRTIRRGERLAVVFHSLNDAALTDGAVSFRVADGVTDLTGIEVMVGQCVNGDAQPLDNAQVTLFE